ncbi:MAG: DUF262 domain-containing HNH endonuclease family protein, partial [Kiritimatiellae bacterium]|nr:DUF262 domain-containing HNH endonuclease family protein [Kiritimatiellia bacterium]
MEKVALESGQSQLVTLAQLLSFDFYVPPFQRPYDWENAQVMDLINDLKEAQKKNVPLFLGLVVVFENKENTYAVVDGQQRLTTLMLALAAWGAVEQVLRSHEGGLSTLWVTPRNADIGFARAVLQSTKETEATLSQRRLCEAFALLALEESIELQVLLKTQLILYVAPTLSGATGLFERINLRGKDVSQFDLVKNKLIEWAGAEPELASKRKIEEFITSRYDKLYQRLDPISKAEPYDSDKLLKIHWILFADKHFKSTEKVLERVNSTLKEVFYKTGSIAKWIERYLDSLVEVAEVWVAVERPYEAMPKKYAKTLQKAMFDFARLNRDGELQPLIVAAIIRWGENATDFISFCEINSFRSALAKHNSNSSRSVKWRFARQLYQKSWRDKTGSVISTAGAAVHQLYWAATPYWNKEEAFEFGDKLTAEDMNTSILPDNALESASFHSEYRRLVHYIFWKYGVYLPKSEEWASFVRSDICPFQENIWFGDEDSFKNWDIEHIYPQNPADRDTKSGRLHMKNMEPWLNHLGNLTVLPIRDNRGMKNSVFLEKLDWLREQRKV